MVVELIRRPNGETVIRVNTAQLIALAIAIQVTLAGGVPSCLPVLS
jgi:hypothetical protein